jgi:hypothetical protein
VEVAFRDTAAADQGEPDFPVNDMRCKVMHN